MPAPIIDDELWALIEPLLPPPKPRRKRYPGRLPVSDRAALNGILLVLKTGMRWNHLPTRLGFGSGATCWRRLHDWQQAGGWDKLHGLLLDKLRESGQLDFSYAAVDSSSVRAVGAGQNWAKPHRSRTTRVQTPHPRRRERRSCPRDPDRREPQRCHATAAAGRRYPSDSLAPAAGRFASPKSSTQTEATIPTRIAADFASTGSARSSPGAALNTTAASANSGGSSNGLIRGSMVSVVFAFVSNADLTFTKHSSN
ncbi:transposase [Paraburkholderia youngii]